MADTKLMNGDNGSKDFHVLIIGAGAAGLLAAQGLKKANIRYTLFEREDLSIYNVRPRDWSMGLHWARREIPPLLPDHLACDIWKIDADPYSEGGKPSIFNGEGANLPPKCEGYPLELNEKQEKAFPIVNLKTGQELTWVSAETSRRTSRRKLREYLRQELQIEHGKKLTKIEDGPGDHVTAFFADGTSAHGNVLLGADSGSSVVRPYVLKPENNRMETFPIRIYNFNQQYTHEQAMFIRKTAGHPLFWYGIHGPTKCTFTSSILDTPDPKDGSTWTFQLGFDVWDTTTAFERSTPNKDLLPPHLPDAKQRVAHMKALAKDNNFCEPFKSSVAWVRDDTYISPDRISHLPEIKPWEGPLAEKGKVVLAGDAAHPMSPYRGQGLNNAVLDVVGFVEGIRKLVGVDRDGKPTGSKEKPTLADTMAKYGEEVRRRGQKETTVSGEQAYAVHHLDAFLKSPVMARGFHR